MQIVEWFVMRWQVEVTFHEVRTHLGVETQRQWSDLAIARTTPGLAGPVLAGDSVGTSVGYPGRPCPSARRHGTSSLCQLSRMRWRLFASSCGSSRFSYIAIQHGYGKNPTFAAKALH